MLRASSEACARFALLAALLMAPAVFGAEFMGYPLTPEEADQLHIRTLDPRYTDFSDPQALVYWALATQLSHANTDQIMPTNPLLRINPKNPCKFYKMVKCERVDVGKCLQHGNSSNGLPKSLQGIFWQDGIVQPEQAISTAGKWDPILRRLNIYATEDPVWAFEGSNSTKAGAFWLPSGAAHFNFFHTFQFVMDLWFNDDITFGQFRGGVFNIPPLLTLGASDLLYNWTMQLTPEGNWYRKSSVPIPGTAGIDKGLADYTLRQIIDGNGERTAQFDGWLKYDDGKPFYYGVPVNVC